MAKTSNSLNLLQVNGSINIKQGDSGTILGYNILDENGEAISELDSKPAKVRLVNGKTNDTMYVTDSIVQNGNIEFNVTSILQPGKYLVEIECNGYVFPSDRKTKVKIIESAKINPDSVVTEPINETISDEGLDPLAAYNLAKL